MSPKVSCHCQWSNLSRNERNFVPTLNAFEIFQNWGGESKNCHYPNLIKVIINEPIRPTLKATVIQRKYSRAEKEESKIHEGFLSIKIIT